VNDAQRTRGTLGVPLAETLANFAQYLSYMFPNEQHPPRFGEGNYHMRRRLHLSPPTAGGATSLLLSIAEWVLPNPLFALTPRGDGHLRFEPGESGQWVVTLANGKEFEVGEAREGAVQGSNALCSKKNGPAKWRGQVGEEVDVSSILTDEGSTLPRGNQEDQAAVKGITNVKAIVQSSLFSTASAISDAFEARNSPHVQNEMASAPLSVIALVICGMYDKKRRLLMMVRPGLERLIEGQQYLVQTGTCLITFGTGGIAVLLLHAANMVIVSCLNLSLHRPGARARCRQISQPVVLLVNLATAMRAPGTTPLLGPQDHKAPA
jgi:hypothetical protein